LNCDVTPTELSYATAGSDRPARLNPVEVFHRLEAHRKPPLLLPLLPLLPLPRPLPLLPLPLPPPQPLPIGGYRGDAQGGYIGDAPGRLIGGDAAGFGGYAQPSVHRPPSLATLERVAIGFAAVWLPPLPSLVMPQCHSALPLSVKIEHSDTEHLDNGADTGHLDTGTDTGHLDTGVDTGHSDTGADTGHSDTGHLDAGADTRADTGQSDTGQSDTEVGTGVDTGNLDTTADPVHVRSGNEGAGVEEEGDEGYELRASQSSRARPRRATFDRLLPLLTRLQIREEPGNRWQLLFCTPAFQQVFGASKETRKSAIVGLRLLAGTMVLSVEQRMEMLRAQRPFSKLPYWALEKVAALTKLQKHPRYATVTRLGQAAKEFGVIVVGALAAEPTWAGEGISKSASIVLRVGDAYGEEALLLPIKNQTKPQDCKLALTALQPTLVLALPLEAVAAAKWEWWAQ